MNKNCYRIVFNKNRGQMMAVAEVASGQGKAASGETALAGGATSGETGGVAFAAKSLQTLRPVFAAVLASLGLVMFTAGVTIGSNAHAQIIADPSAPSNQRPTVLSSGNGVPLVNIQTPSAAGVSRNTYRQFDVNGQGVILNNSRTNVQTQLGGFVQGNPWLARGSARVILNEVNSSAPSQLRGYVEVGGQRAEVIIANPAGVAIDGAGFINASRVTITTGSPIVNGGSLEGYLVQRGDVTINGRGLDTSTADYTAILARAVQVNGGIWAKELNVITGANQIAAPAGGSASVAGKLAGSGAQPMYALDVSELGGMYAGKILLIGTESGVGVRNAGSIGASAGQVRVSVDGMLTNIGSITAAGNVQLQTFGSTGGSTGLVANGITNTGTIYAQADTTLDAQGNISNAGFIAAKGNTALQATGAGAAVTSGAGSVLAAGLNADGSVSNSGNLNIAASGVSLNGRTAAGANLTVSAEQISLSQSNVSANDLSLTAAQTVDASQANVSATGVLAVNAGQTVRADGAAVSANRLQINVNSLSNVGGQLIQTGAGNTAINVQGTLDNTRGRIASNGDSVALSAQTLLNETGKLEHAGAGSLTITAQTLNSQNGQITGNGALVVSAGNVDHRLASTQANSVTINAVNFDNQGGDITQFGNGTTTINASNALDNRSGVIASNGNTRISAASLANQDGAVRANGVANLDLAVTGVLNNDAGTVSTAGNLTVVTGRLSNEVGSITANGSLNASSTQGFNNTRGLVAATQNLTVSAADLNNTRGSLASVRANASITTTGRTLNSSGNVQAEGSVTLTASGVDNSSAVGQTRGGTIAGQSIAIDATAQQFNNQLGTVVGTQGVSITSGALNNSAGLIQAGTAAVIDTNGQGLTNTNAAGYGSSVPGSAGGIVSAGTLVLASGALDNAGGYIGAVGAMSGATAQLTNRAGGEIASSSNIDWVATGINNQQGSIQANGNINLNAQTGTLNNQAGLLLSNSALGTVTLAAAAVVNSNTRSANRGIAATNVVVTSAAVDNTDGAIVADNNLTVTAAGTVNNTNGLVSAGNALLIEDTANTRALAIDNTAGTLIAGQSNTLRARNLTGGGKVQSQNDVSIDLTGNFSNGAGAEVVARRNLSVAVGGNLVNQGQLQAGQILTVAASNVDNTATGDMLGNTTRVTVVNTLTNRGIIDGVTTEINATTLNNIGTGRIYGDQLSIAATAVNNTSEVTGGVTQAGTIAARDTLNIGAQYVNNSDGALIFSAGNLSIGGALDSNRNAIGRAADIQNTGATIEALGNVDITTARLGNNNTALAYVLSTGSNGQKTDYRTGAGTWYSDADVAWVGFAQSAADEPSTSGFSFGPDFRVNINFYVPVTAPRYTNPIFGTYFNGPRAIREAYEVCSGGYDSQTCTTFPMLLSYDKNSTIWADLGVTAPTVDIPGPKPSATVCDSSQDQTVCSPRPQKELDDWEAAATPWRLLQTRLTSFVAEMRPPAGEYDRQITSDYRTYTETTTTPVVTSTKPARILSGGDLVIDASQSAVNEDSRIIAGRTLTIRGATVDNRELQINAPTVRNGVVSIYGQVDEDCDFFGDCEPIYGYRRSAYYQEFPRTVRLNTVSYQQNTVPGPSNASALQLAAAAAASAVGPTAAAALGNAVVNGGNANITPVSAVTSAPLVTGGLGAVRSMAVPQPLPSSLFRNNPSATGNYLIETDPRFANYGKWLSSDYMLGQLGIDPASIQKRLGDGFYEQRLVNEQIAQLTGQRYLANYTSQDQQYRALMDNAVTYAKQFNVRPGIALSAAQMAQLTSDIVWLVEQTVTLPDGRTAQALVPRVYVRVQPGDIDGNGSLLAGHQVNINLTGDINNTGTIAGRDVVRLSGQNVTNLGGRINANAVGIKANVDVNNIGGAITAGSQLVVTAGRDINITTQTSSATNRAGVGVFSATTIDRVAGLYVTGNAQGQGTLIASAGRDILDC